MRWILVALAAALGPVPQARAEEPPSFGPPLACDFAAGDCRVTQYMDVDMTPMATDMGCGHLTSDGHSGTDFAVRDGRDVHDGVAVLAVAPGTVLRVRDGVADTVGTGPPLTMTGDDDCGNGVIVDHGGGWHTRYCHLRRGSVRVEQGETVARGQALAQVGLSGLAEYAHLHLTVVRDGRPVDPFRGLDLRSGCGGAADGGLWDEATRKAIGDYRPFVVRDLGFAMGKPRKDEARAGTYRGDVLPAAIPALVFWVDVFGLMPGDGMTMRLTGPDGAVIARGKRVVKDHLPQWFGFIFKKAEGGAFAPGRYTADVIVARPTPGRQSRAERSVGVTLK